MHACARRVPATLPVCSMPATCRARALPRGAVCLRMRQYACVCAPYAGPQSAVCLRSAVCWLLPARAREAD
eukprot:1355284-Pyramimonas_sp.AAC.1